MPYVYSLPNTTSFDGKGLFGYSFGPLSQKDLEVLYIEVKKGHDTFMVSKKITRTYYVLCGSGHFTIADCKYDVGPGMLVEVPPKIEYSYSGNMKLIAVCKPRWFAGNDTHTKWNLDVIGQHFPPPANAGSWLGRLLRLKVFGKSPTNAFLRLNRRLWFHLPVSFTALGPVLSYGNFLHRLARTQGVRAQAFSTFFLRNRPQLELIRRLAVRCTQADTLRVAVVGCSTGAEAYSVAWTIRSARRDLRVILRAVDISQQAVEVGRRGAYSRSAPELTNSAIFDRMTGAEIDELFCRDGDVERVKLWIKEGIEWSVGDVADTEIVDALGPQDIVVANNFLCHMNPSMAERCLRNIARLVRPDGYLFVSGIDLDIRTKVANELGWNPLQELLEEIHEGDPCMKSFWPCQYAGLEPLNKRRQDWRIRYAAAFELVPPAEDAQNLEDFSMMVENVGGGSIDRGASAAASLADQPARVSDAR